MTKNKFEQIISNRYVKWLLLILGLVFYAVMVILPGVCFLFLPVLVCFCLCIPIVLIFPAVLLFKYKQKLNAVLYMALPMILYTAIGIYLSTRAWHERAGINIASALAKTDGFGLLKRTNYALVPRLVFLGVSGILLDCLYALSFLKKMRWRWFFIALSIVLVVGLFVFWHYIKML